MFDRILLFPYSLTLAMRNAIYKKGSKKVRKAAVPTICVGNITAGGTGKTPHTELILQMLLESDEWGARNIAMLSRGYKRGSKGFQQVMLDSSAAFCGDEPLQIKKKRPGVTVAVDKNRIEGCDFLVHPEKLQDSKAARKCVSKDMAPADIIVLDDAFQYRKLGADLNIVLVDYNRPVTRDRLIPFGKLRDLPSRLKQADVIVVSKCPIYMEDAEKEAFAKVLKFKEYDPENCIGVRKSGQRQIILFSCVRYGQSVPIYDSADPRYIYTQQVVLFSGIAKDEPLCNYLSGKYKVISHYSFPDHHRYTKKDIRKISRVVSHNSTAAVATTEKDAQRVLDFQNMPQQLKERMFMVPITVDFISERERELFRQIILSV